MLRFLIVWKKSFQDSVAIFTIFISCFTDGNEMTPKHNRSSAKQNSLQFFRKKEVLLPEQ